MAQPAAGVPAFLFLAIPLVQPDYQGALAVLLVHGEKALSRVEVWKTQEYSASQKSWRRMFPLPQ